MDIQIILRSGQGDIQQPSILVILRRINQYKEHIVKLLPFRLVHSGNYNSGCICLYKILKCRLIDKSFEIRLVFRLPVGGFERLYKVMANFHLVASAECRIKFSLCLLPILFFYYCPFLVDMQPVHKIPYLNKSGQLESIIGLYQFCRHTPVQQKIENLQRFVISSRKHSYGASKMCLHDGFHYRHRKIPARVIDRPQFPCLAVDRLDIIFFQSV